MERAIKETDRRRKIQEDYNTKHSIKPIGITKKVSDVMEGARSVKGKSKTRRKLDKIKETSFKPIEDLHDPVALKKEIILVEDMMYKYAKNLEFEEAAAYRDRVAELKQKLIMT